jgi:major type 1 subunit fimbrin (pilin)
MKNSFIATSILSILSFFNIAHAVNTIEFTGEISSSTCEVSLSGGTGVSSVTLPTVASDLLAAADDTAGRTEFSLSAKNCVLATGETKVAAFFQGAETTNVDVATGYLNNTATATPAKNVKLRISDGVTGTPIKVGDAGQVTSNTAATIVDGNAVMPYLVEYIATGAATAGAVRGTVVYDLTYQ